MKTKAQKKKIRILLYCLTLVVALLIAGHFIYLEVQEDANLYPFDEIYWDKVVHVYSEEEIADDSGKADVYFVDLSLGGEKKPFVLICPGGCYQGVSMDWEGIPTAEEVNRCGYSAFVLNYRTAENAKHPNPQDDVAATLKYIFAHAEEFNVEVENYAIMGFSAGGHLAGSFCTKNVGYAQYDILAPQTAILVYPVLTMGEYTHSLSKENLIGADASQELIDEYSVENHVDGDFPPTFMWGREGDLCSYQGDMLFKARMDEEGVDIVHEVYPGTEHGEALGTGGPMEGWVTRAVAFWEEHIGN